MAHIVVDENDYIYLAQAANGASIAGLEVLAEGLDTLARKVYAAMHNQGSDKKIQWQECPSVIVPQKADQ